MAKTYAGGTQVSRGYYINARTFEFANIARDGMPLPARPDAKFLRIPTVVAMAAAPAIGGLFVIALPLIVVAVVSDILSELTASQSPRGLNGVDVLVEERRHEFERVCEVLERDDDGEVPRDIWSAV